jgi:hypothetical protein
MEAGLLKDLNRNEAGKLRWVDPESGRPITPHGRATSRTRGEDSGFSRDLLEEALGHQIGTPVERAYRGRTTGNAVERSCRPGQSSVAVNGLSVLAFKRRQCNPLSVPLHPVVEPCLLIVNAFQIKAEPHERGRQIWGSIMCARKTRCRSKRVLQTRGKF